LGNFFCGKNPYDSALEKDAKENFSIEKTKYGEF